MHIGLPYETVQLVPLSELLDLIAIQQIKEEGYRYRNPAIATADELNELLSMR